MGSVANKWVNTQRKVLSAFFIVNFRPTKHKNGLQVYVKLILGLLRIKITSQYSPENKSNHTHFFSKTGVFSQSYGGFCHG